MKSNKFLLNNSLFLPTNFPIFTDIDTGFSHEFNYCFDFYIVTLRRGRPREQLLLQNYKA